MIGISSERRVEIVGLVVLAEHPAVVDALGEHVRGDLVGGLLPLRGALVSPRALASCTPRSAAIQHITLDATKCFGSPRISQMP